MIHWWVSRSGRPSAFGNWPTPTGRRPIPNVIESDRRTDNAQHLLALDPFPLAVLKLHVETLDRERKDFGSDDPRHQTSANQTKERPSPDRK
jgi:hypothetical protein